MTFEIGKLSVLNIELVSILGRFRRDEITWQEADNAILKLIKDASYVKLADDQSQVYPIEWKAWNETAAYGYNISFDIHKEHNFRRVEL